MGRGGEKPVDRCTESYQWAAQTPSLARGPGGQLSIFSLNGMPKASQRLVKTRRGAPSRESASITGGAVPMIEAASSKSSSCSTKPMSRSSTCSRFAA
jgi:hypothetical protein